MLDNFKEAEKYNGLGNNYKNIFDLKNAEFNYKEALKFMPKSAIILCNLGSIYNLMGDVDQAKIYFQKAVEIEPNFPNAHYSLAKIYLAKKFWDKAISHCTRSIELDPNFKPAYSLLTFSKMQICDWDSQLNYNPHFDNPMLSLLRIEDKKINYQVANYWSDLIEKKMVGFPEFKYENRNRSKKITIGYLSDDFYPHAISSLITGLFKNHNKSDFNINIYSYCRDANNVCIRKFRKDVNIFRDISNISDFEAAQQINVDNVDILVDLKGYSGESRMEIFTLHPTPIQITWLGFPGTTGANFIDYILTDKIVTPKPYQKYFSEKFLYLPNSYQINDNEKVVPKKNLERSFFGLNKDDFIFCSFNRPEKITPKTFDSWMTILKNVPQSSLWLLKDNDQMVTNLQKAAIIKGVNPNKLVFAEPIKYTDHLNRHSLVDLYLDTFTYNGHTTTSDCLWAGVPVVTLQGKHFASRVASSLLTAVGLPELITHSQKEYENLAVELATNPKKLDIIRKSLILNLKSKPLFDTKKFVKNLEKLYIKVYEKSI